MFPKVESKNKKVKIDTTKSIKQRLAFNDELLDELDEINEDQMYLLKDSDFLQTIALTESDIESKFDFDHLKEDQEIYDNVKSSKSKEKL